MQLAERQDDYPIYYIMSDQPDCCGKCGSRVDLLEIKMIDGERVFVTECLGCHRETLIVEE
ncbi:MAG: hypothetical protein K2P67_05515 [Gallionellaceae bacterium]|nr:hypothetical protein [Gallionellaceae bacterium]